MKKMTSKERIGWFFVYLLIILAIISIVAIALGLLAGVLRVTVDSTLVAQNILNYVFIVLFAIVLTELHELRRK